MAVLYVKNTGSNTSPYDTWAKAATTLATAASAAAAGDTIWVSNNHAESSASSITNNFTNGTVANPIYCLCGNDGAQPPTALATGATVTTTGNSPIGIGGNAYVYGITWSTGTGANAAATTLTNLLGAIVYEKCQFIVPQTAGASINLSSSTSRPSKFINCDFKFGATSQLFQATGLAEIIGGSILSGSSTPTGLFSNTGFLRVTGMDLSNLAATVNIAAGGSNSQAPLMVRNCKMPTSWSGTLFGSAQTGPAGQGVVWFMNNDASATNYVFLNDGYGGSTKQETSIVRTGGASNGVTPISWRMASSANVKPFALTPAQSLEIAIWNDLTGSSVTATIEIASDGASALNNNDVWVEYEYLGSSAAPLSTHATSAPNFVTAASAITSSSASWPNATGTGPNGSSTWQIQKLQVSFTPQLKGIVLARVFVGKASWTVFVDPKISIA